MNKNDCIEKICNLSVDFKVSNKSPYTLAAESKFRDLYKDISLHDIREYLSVHLDLIDKWDMWSSDKRTHCGFFLSISDAKYLIGAINSEGKKIFKKEFKSELDACSEYILREIAGILDINLQLED